MHTHSTALPSASLRPIAAWTAPNGCELVLRRPCRADVRKSLAFLRGLSYASRYFRFGRGDLEFRESEARALCDPDPAICADFIVLAREREGEVEVASARYCIDADESSCEFALVVADRWQGLGLGERLMRVMIDSARARGLHHMHGTVLATNSRMLQLAEECGFVIEESEQGPGVKRVSRALGAPAAGAASRKRPQPLPRGRSANEDRFHAT